MLNDSAFHLFIVKICFFLTKQTAFDKISGMKVEKGRSKQYYFFKSLAYIKPYKGYAFACIMSCTLVAGVSVLIPIFTEKSLTSFTSHDGKGLLINSVLLLVFELLTSIIHMLLWGTTADRLRARITRDIRYNTIDSIMRLKIRNFDIYGSGRLIQVVSGDTAVLSGLYTSMVDGFMSFLSKIAIYVYIFSANYILGIYCVLEFAVVAWVYHFRIRTRMKDQAKLKKETDKNISFINETIKGVRDVKNYNIYDSMLEKASGSLDNLEKIDKKYGQKQYQLFRVTIITRNLMSFLFIPLALLLIHYNLTTFAVALTVFIFRNNATGEVDWLMGVWENIKDGGFYAERIFDVINGYNEGFEEFPENDNFKKLPKNPDIKFKDLSFSYNEEKQVLSHLDLEIQQGSKIAIVGESGSGKSTLLKLLNKTYDVEKGQIFIGGYDICDFSRNTLRNTITIVPQDPYIFNFSILENLKIMNPNASKRQIENACKKAQIHDFILSQPDGYHTKLGEGGARLSGGQKQRLAIARAFLKDSPILVFDETTSALDNENQNKIKEAINNISRNKIVIIVAHRLSTIVDADIIHFLKDGKILTSGTHKQLLKSCKEYKRLYEHENTRQTEVEKFEEFRA